MCGLANRNTGTGRHEVSHTPPPKKSNAVRRTQKDRQFRRKRRLYPPVLFGSPNPADVFFVCVRIFAGKCGCCQPRNVLMLFLNLVAGSFPPLPLCSCIFQGHTKKMNCAGLASTGPPVGWWSITGPSRGQPTAGISYPGRPLHLKILCWVKE